MSIIYGIDINKPIKAIDVREAIIECFTNAHNEVLDKELENLGKGIANEGIQKLKHINVRLMIKDYFKEVGGDFNKPSKKVLIAVCDKLAEFAKIYRGEEIIRRHYNEIMQLINKL